MNDYNENLHIGAHKSTMQNAHDLRMDLTKAEKILWEALRNRRLNNCKFRRQHALEIMLPTFIATRQNLSSNLTVEFMKMKSKKNMTAIELLF